MARACLFTAIFMPVLRSAVYSCPLEKFSIRCNTRQLRLTYRFRALVEKIFATSLIDRLALLQTQKYYSFCEGISIHSLFYFICQFILSVSLRFDQLCRRLNFGITAVRMIMQFWGDRIMCIIMSTVRQSVFRYANFDVTIVESVIASRNIILFEMLNNFLIF